MYRNRTIAGTALCATLSMAFTSADAYWSVDFEEPTYTEGVLFGPGGVDPQDEWVYNGGGISTNRQIVVGGADGFPSAVSGTQLLMIGTHSTQNEQAFRQWNDTQVTDPFRVEAWLAYNPMGADNFSGLVYINDENGSSSGAIFGFNENHLAARDGNSYIFIDADHSIDGMTAALPNTFYRFVVDVRPADAKFDVSAYNQQGQLLGTVADIGSRGGIGEFSWLRLTTFGSATGSPAGSSLYVDDISIAIPEPASLVLLGAGAMVLIGRARRKTA